ncbi:MAG: hypothetical protein P8Y24_11550 [Gammaproteobacteria bacterium]|jgi:hypothetical protein
MKKTIEINGKKLAVSLSPAAENELRQRSSSLLAEMELYFSCLIRKAVRFHETIEDNDVSVSDKLAVRFRPVMTKKCEVSKDGSPPPLTEFPIENGERYIPHWLKIDFKKGKWSGEFGYADKT